MGRVDFVGVYDGVEIYIFWEIFIAVINIFETLVIRCNCVVVICRK